MANTIVSTVDGSPVLIEIDELPVTRDFSADLAKSANKVTDALDNAQTTILNIARKMVGAVQSDAALTPDEFELTFNLKFTAEGQAFIAKLGSEASLGIKMTFKPKAKTE